MFRRSLLLLSLLATTACQPPQPTIEDARKFIGDANTRLLKLSSDGQRADWVKSTFITDDTETIAAQADERAIAAQVDLVKQCKRFDGLKLPPDLDRQFYLLKVSLVMPTPADPAAAAELTRTATAMEGTYGKGKYCKQGKC